MQNKKPAWLWNSMSRTLMIIWLNWKPEKAVRFAQIVPCDAKIFYEDGEYEKPDQSKHDS